MPIEVKFYHQFLDFAVAPEDVQFGEADSVEVTVNYNGKMIKENLVRKSVTITLRGLTVKQSLKFVQELERNSKRKLTGAFTLETFTIGIERIEDAVLSSVKTSLPIEIQGQKLIETTQLEYRSLKYT